MNDLHRALGDIRNIRRQLAENTEFRGYGPLTLVTTTIFAFIGGVLQATLLPHPSQHPLRYTALWSGVALCSIILLGITTTSRTRRLHSGLEQEMIHRAIAQFLPSLVSGSLLTLVLLHFVKDSLWLLPPLWQIIYSLGIFSSARFLPKAIYAAAVWFLATGLLCLTFANARSLAPWTMSISFGLGQMLIAAILQFANLESKNNDDE